MYSKAQNIQCHTIFALPRWSFTIFLKRKMENVMNKVPLPAQPQYQTTKVFAKWVEFKYTMIRPFQAPA